MDEEDELIALGDDSGGDESMEDQDSQELSGQRGGAAGDLAPRPTYRTQFWALRPSYGPCLHKEASRLMRLTEENRRAFHEPISAANSQRRCEQMTTTSK